MSQVASKARAYPGFLQRVATRSISTPPGWDASPLQQIPPALNLPVPIYTPERREAL